MSNLNFYAIDNDYEQILNFVFSELDCRCFESYSEPMTDLTEFKSAEEVINHFNLKSFSKVQHQSAEIIIWPTAASQNIMINKVKLDPRRCNGATYRYCIEGWGMIQLQYKGINEEGLQYSNLSHNSETRAMSWHFQYSDKMGSPNSWDWKEVSRTSRKLNNFIKKNALDKIGALPIMSCATNFELFGV